ncbi:WXG100 family type VII secretion target [Paractinoplanes durhamensis]|uniref:Uncharacterized protein n=1 Tax=Paractinoplanes durhamensis TaxID=113563 RepID=A0ABQ3YXT6_9ACTN|nr:hypothetical protein [Actinoplanes durhamensis]GIE02397.1 hypothetical protein Adu01nite_37470 [Actinoplanes durhamensis]
MTNPLVASEQSSTTWYTGLGLVEDAEQISSGIHDNSWVDGTLGTVGGTLDVLGMVIDPIGSLVAWGVSWLMEHVKPLKDALDWLAGNPDAIAAHATTWQNVSKFSADAQAQFMDAIRQEVADWQGSSGDAYREHAGMLAQVISGISSAAHGISYAVEGAGLLVGLVRGIVRDLIAQFIATLAARLPQWLAEEGLTLGLATPVVIGQVAALVAKWVEKIQHFIRGLLSSLRRLIGKVGSLGDVLDGLTGKLSELLRSVPGGGKSGGGEEPNLPKGWHEGDQIPAPRSGGELPTDAHLGGRYVGENDPTNPSRAFYPDTVHYMDDAEREAHRLFVDGDGNLRSAADGSLYDTSTGTTAWSGGGRAIFTMDGSGNLYATLDQRVGQTHHSSLLAGDSVVGAGEIEVVDGKLVAMTDQSGHYHPGAEMNDKVLQSLRDQGLLTDPDFKQYGWGGEER